ncbi:MAG: hypothetical protein SVZ03_14890 [Spirochaetota bacterium]|nr:hypothetical protein [Spirochaetota bacterium]
MYIPKYNFIIILTFIYSSCYYYFPVRLSKNHLLSQKDITTEAGQNIEEKDIINLSFHKRRNDSEHSTIDEKIYKIYLKRYFAKSVSFSPIARINNRGVEYAMSGYFGKALILFNESINEYKSYPPAYNNLGIIYELFGHRQEAYKMYSKACLLEPENEYFKKNFIFFHNHKR